MILVLGSLAELTAVETFGQQITCNEKVMYFFYPQLGTITLALHADTLWVFANATVKGFSLIKETID